ncbi:MAG: AAA family ATPase [Bryobacterales bacterium]|nr:AAA family ATPase [Bryobacterales bacterium]
MIRRFYVNNYRCLQNFELPIAEDTSILLIGKNGCGKTTIANAIEVLQRLARGTNRVGDLVTPNDFAFHATGAPIRLAIQADIQSRVFDYEVAFELPAGFRELRVFDESLTVNGERVYTRDRAQVSLVRRAQSAQRESVFLIDWHLVALPLIQQQSTDDPVSMFREWLSRLLILRPNPSLMTGESRNETLHPNTPLSNFADWFSGVLAHAPSAYRQIDSYLQSVMPDLSDIQNPSSGTDARRLVLHFKNEHGGIKLGVEDLSDGEKCFLICALVIAANRAYGPLCCFWDEPDNFLALSEVGHFVQTLRNEFASGGQFIATSHNPEAIRKFSDDNTLLLERRSHLEPTRTSRLSDLHVDGDLINSLILGDIGQ